MVWRPGQRKKKKKERKKVRYTSGAKMKPHVQEFTHTRVTRGYSVLFLCLIALTQSCKGVGGQRTVVAPKDSTISLNDTAVFQCSASDVLDISFIVKDVNPSDWTSRRIMQSDVTLNDGVKSSSLMIFGNEKNNGCLIICQVILSVVSYEELQPAALLSITGMADNGTKENSTGMADNGTKENSTVPTVTVGATTMGTGTTVTTRTPFLVALGVVMVMVGVMAVVVVVLVVLKKMGHKHKIVSSCSGGVQSCSVSSCSGGVQSV